MERKHHRYTLPSGTSKSQTKNYRPSENDHVQKGPENDNTVTFVTKHFPVKLLINTNKNIHCDFLLSIHLMRYIFIKV